MPIGKNCHSGHRWGCADRAGDDFRASRVHRHRSSPTLPSAAPYVLYISQVSYKSCEHNIKLTKQAKAPFIPLGCGSSQVVALWPARWELYYKEALCIEREKLCLTCSTLAKEPANIRFSWQRNWPPISSIT